MIKNCLQCHKDFVKPAGLANKLWQKRQFCSRLCSDIARKGILKTERKNVVCKVCTKNFQVLPYRVKPTYCSRLCQNRDKKGATSPNWKGGTKPCTNCKTINKDRHSLLCRFCSNKTKLGNKNPAWKGGSTPLVRSLRTCVQYHEWRKAVFTRDNYTCVVCQDRGYINADHIKPFSLILQENNIDTVDKGQKCKDLWDVKNGRTLCVPCHKMTSTYGYGSRKVIKKSICL